MRRLFSFILILFLLSLFCTSAQAYGSSLRGRTEIDLNVTIVNTAEHPKFVIVNPTYKFKIFRAGNESTGEKLNNVAGFWIMPYETVKINLKITETSTYPVSVPSCSGNEFICGVIYPPLINHPKIQSFASLFPFIDRNIKVLKIEGVVTFNVTNPAGGDVFFAMAPPVLFDGARTYAYYPNYTMNYSEYVGDFIWKFRDIKPPEDKEKKLREPSLSLRTTLFHVTPTLLSGVRVPRFERYLKKVASKFDFPVWIVFMRKEIVVTYRVSWRNSGR